ncbi:uncharacterized protein [Spinacia oleracea]|uniref:Uncharacterized protein isoform X3 n=1 Tax=Spinacia oleracea TaxID=3562 RepID=A0A9R0JA10_SPIOL|nr:uncharacterized protein LOC110802225 isoform X3 [Spinacia oleracea]
MPDFMGKKMSRFRNCGKFNLNEVAEFEVHSSSNSEQDDSEDRDFNADIVDDEDDDELLNPVSTTTMKQKRGRPKGSKNKQQAIVEKKVTKVKVTLETRVFEDNSFTKGGEVKEAGDVLKVLQEEYKGRRSLNSFSPSIWPSNSAVELSRRRTQQPSNSGVARPCVAVFAGGSVFSPHLPHRVLFSPSQSQVFRSLTLSCANLFEEEAFSESSTNTRCR